MGASTIEKRVHEEAHLLEALRSRCRSRSEKARVGMLIQFKNDPFFSIGAAARAVGVAKSTLLRWWSAYAQAGLRALFAERLLPADLSASGTGRQSDSEMISLGRLKGLVTSLPASGTSAEMAVEIGEALSEFLGDVDQVSVAVDHHALRQGEGAPTVALIDGGAAAGGATAALIVASTGNVGDSVVTHLRSTVFRSRKFRDPIRFDIHVASGHFLGTVLLWRLRSKPAISVRTVGTMDALTPLLRYVLRDVVVRHHERHSTGELFLDLVEQAVVRFQLSSAEHRTLVQALLGESARTAAKKLGISVDTYRSQLHTVYNKAQTNNCFELVGRLFTQLAVGDSSPI